MRTLVVLRHAKAVPPDGLADVDRPLAGRGRRDAPVAGRWLREHVPGIDAVVCSPALRTVQTWRLVAAELTAPPDARLEPAIYEASVRDLLDVVWRLPTAESTVLLVGHNPGLTGLVHELTGAWVELRTSSVAVLRLADDWVYAGTEPTELVESATPRRSAGE